MKPKVNIYPQKTQAIESRIAWQIFSYDRGQKGILGVRRKHTGPDLVT